MSDKDKALAESLRLEGKTVKYIARRMHYSEASITNATKGMAENYKRWNREETQRLMELRSKKMPFTDIAVILNRTRSSCIKKYHHYRNASVGR